MVENPERLVIVRVGSGPVTFGPATNPALAVDLAVRGITGRMVALREGRYTHVAADMPKRGVKRVDVDEFYDRDQYKPKVAHVQGKPMFLY